MKTKNPDKIVKILRACSFAFWSLYAAFLVSLIVKHWPDSLGWQTALLWLLMYVLMQEQNYQLLELCGKILKWSEKYCGIETGK